MVIAAVEEAVLSAVEAAFNDVRTGSLGGGWTLDSLRRALQLSPGVYISFLGGKAADYKSTKTAGRFELYIVTKGAVEPVRRSRGLGAYELIETLVPLLHQLPVPDVGVLRFEQVNNLFKEAAFKMGGSVYALAFSIDLYFELPQAPQEIATHLSFSANGQTTEIF